MTAASPFATVTAALATPFGADHGVDFERLVRHASWLLSNGCDGLVLFGTTGESPSLTLTERKEILQRLVGAGVPAQSLLVGTGCCALADTVALTLHARDVGAAGVLVLPPFFFKGVSDRGIAAYYDGLIAACGADAPPIYLYNIPQVTGAAVTADLAEYLIQRHGPRIRGYKDSSGDWANTLSIVKRFPGLHVYIGSEARLLDHLRAGGVGCISASVNVQPAAVRRLYDYWRSASADELQAEVTECRKVLETGGALIPNVKAMLAVIHQHDEWSRLRPPLETVSTQARAALAARLRRLEAAMA